MSYQIPDKSYIVWHTQRTGSTLLCTTLEETGVAGNPQEWPEDLEARVNAKSAEEVLNELRHTQTTENGVFGVKFGYYEPKLNSLFKIFGVKDESGNLDLNRTWDFLFPNCQHIVMTRRDKIRLAVSWWKSIRGGPGHLGADGALLPWQESVPTAPTNLESSFSFESIKGLIIECVRREAALQDLLVSLAANPLTITYEDFVSDYEGTVRAALNHIGAPAVREIPVPLLTKTSDEVNEVWVERFRTELGEP